MIWRTKYHHNNERYTMKSVVFDNINLCEFGPLSDTRPYINAFKTIPYLFWIWTHHTLSIMRIGPAWGEVSEYKHTLSHDGSVWLHPGERGTEPPLKENMPSSLLSSTDHNMSLSSLSLKTMPFLLLSLSFSSSFITSYHQLIFVFKFGLFYGKKVMINFQIVTVGERRARC